MPKHRRIIRRTESTTFRTFDDYFWPVVLSIVLFAGCTCGVILAYLRFDDPRWYANAWTALLTVPLLTAAGIAVVRIVDNRRIRRATQLAVILGLIVNMMLVVMLDREVFSRIFESVRTVERIEPRSIVAPEYLQLPEQKERNSPEKLTQPVEVKMTEQVPEEVEREAEQPEERPTPTQLPSVAEIEKTIQPNIVQRRLPSAATPRRSDDASLLSRQQSQNSFQPNTQAEVPQTNNRSTRRNSQSARNSALQRQASQSARTLTTKQQPTVATAPESARIARRIVKPTPRNKTPSSSQLRRQRTEPQQVSRTPRDVESPQVRKSSRPEPLEAKKTEAPQQTTRAVVTQEPVPPSETLLEIPPETPVEIRSKMVRRQSPAEARPAVAQTVEAITERTIRNTARPTVGVTVNPRTVPNDPDIRQQELQASTASVQRKTMTSAAEESTQRMVTEVPVERSQTALPQRLNSTAVPQVSGARASSTPRRPARANLPNVATVDSEAVANASPSVVANPEPRAASSSISRQRSPQAIVTRTQPALETATQSPATRLARVSTPRRSTTSSLPTLSPEVNSEGAPKRTSRSAEKPTSPANAESPAMAQRNVASPVPTAQAVPMAFTRSVAGVAGRGESRNLDRARPAEQSPAMTASGSLRRARATQKDPPEAALTPSAPAQIARVRAEADRPRAIFQAQPITNAAHAGVQQPTKDSTDATAAITRSQASAEAGEVTASVGQVQVDLGSTRIVDEGERGRAAGGGQPEINTTSLSQQIARSATGGAPTVTLAVELQAEVAAAPAGNAGGSPPTMATSAAELQVVRTEVGGESPTAGGPTAALERGDLTEATSTETLAELAIRRAGGADQGQQPESEAAEQKQRGQITRNLERALPAAAINTRATPVSRPAQVVTNEDSTVIPSQEEAALTRRSDSALPTGLVESIVRPRQEVGTGQSTAVALQRAEAVDAVSGNPVAGGGSDSPARRSVGPALMANIEADEMGMPETISSNGPADATAVMPESAEARDISGAVTNATGSPSIGVGAGPPEVESETATAGGSQVQLASAAGENGPEMNDDLGQTSGVGRRKRTKLPAGTLVAASVEASQQGRSKDAATLEAEALADDMGDVGPMSRQSAKGLEVEVEAEVGAGGLGDKVAFDVGVNNRRAQSVSMEIHNRPHRYVRKGAGSPPNSSTEAVIATESFRRRGARKLGEDKGDETGVMAPQTEAAIELGLVYLLKSQEPDGRWALQGHGEEVPLHSDTAATSLALLAFQGAGYNHREHQYADIVAAGLDYLLKNQKENGDLFEPLDDESNKSVWLYSHSLAAIALCEAYGMTQDSELRGPAQRAINFIVDTQHPTKGGWRYGTSPEARSTDTSVTGWMVMALKSGELAGLDIAPDVYEGVKSWLDLAQVSDENPYLYRYNPFAPNTEKQSHGRKSSKTITSVGLLMRLYTGWRRDKPAMIQGADYLSKHLPAIGTARQPQRDTYYWYYATQVMFHMGGEHWRAWNDRLHPLLVGSQIKTGKDAGSWDPRRPLPDRWALHAGRLFVTTMNLLSLEVHYRHLPLYGDSAD